MGVASVLAGASSQNLASGDDVMSSLVKTVRGSYAEYALDEPKVESVLNDICSLGALDFVTSIYDSTDFYASGYWGTDGNSFKSDIYSGELPAYSKDDFIRPVRGGEFTSLFGYRESYHRMHKGIDISINEGDSVMAAFPGVVGKIGYEPGGYGHFVILVHSGGVETRYAHLSRVTAVLGEEVSAGQGIALGGSTGNSTGPHLHFEIRKYGKAMDPLTLFEM